MSTAYRILVSIPFDSNLSPSDVALKNHFLDTLKADGLEPQIFGITGEIASDPGAFKTIKNYLKRCQGVVVLGLAHQYISQNSQFDFATEYNHLEAGMAISQGLPVFIVKAQSVASRGIFSIHGGEIITTLASNASPQWLDTDSVFRQRYTHWRDTVKKRYHLFLGYSSQASGTAALVKNFLQSNGVRVLDWATDFSSGGTILRQIEDADSKCLGGLFLFTKDDELLSGDTRQSAPRDNVIFEAGYFINSKGDERVLVILEDGAKVPADFGGQIYLPLQNRNNISSIETRLLKFVKDNL